jgi:hypothetical protein
MDHHGWDEWPDDEPGDTADLGDADAGLGGPGDLDPGPGLDHGDSLDHGDPWLPAGDEDAFGAGPDVTAGSGGGEPLPDDTFGADDVGGLDADGSDGPPELAGFAAAADTEPPTDTDAGPPADTGAGDGPDAAGPDGGEPDGGLDDGLAAVDHLVGADPDVDPQLDDPGWHDTTFPPPLGLEQVPEPVDGFPWSDPDLLGDPVDGAMADVEAAWDAPSVGDLFAYAGLEVPVGGDAWGLLLASDDPATAALARWWAPGG